MTAKIKLNAASGGGSFSLQAPSSSSNNRVFTIPDVADGTIATTATSGKVLQVISVVDSSAQTTINTTSYTDAGSLSVAITPSSSSNKVLIMTQVNVQIYAAHQESNGHSRLVRGSTEIIEYPYFGSLEAAKSPSNRIYQNRNHVQMYLDSPSTTSATTYKVQLKLINTSYGQVLYYNQNSSSSVITAMEIAA